MDGVLAGLPIGNPFDSSLFRASGPNLDVDLTSFDLDLPPVLDSYVHSGPMSIDFNVVSGDLDFLFGPEGLKVTASPGTSVRVSMANVGITELLKGDIGALSVEEFDSALNDVATTPQKVNKLIRNLRHDTDEEPSAAKRLLFRAGSKPKSSTRKIGSGANKSRRSNPKPVRGIRSSVVSRKPEAWSKFEIKDSEGKTVKAKQLQDILLEGINAAYKDTINSHSMYVPCSEVYWAQKGWSEVSLRILSFSPSVRAIGKRSVRSAGKVDSKMDMMHSILHGNAFKGEIKFSAVDPLDNQRYQYQVSPQANGLDTEVRVKVYRKPL